MTIVGAWIICGQRNTDQAMQAACRTRAENALRTVPRDCPAALPGPVGHFADRQHAGPAVAIAARDEDLVDDRSGIPSPNRDQQAPRLALVAENLPAAGRVDHQGSGPLPSPIGPQTRNAAAASSSSERLRSIAAN